jgi:acetamidase/formamidase
MNDMTPLKTTKSTNKVHHLPATLDTIQWGYFDGDVAPALHVNSGDYVEIECLAHHAGDAADYMMDDAIRHIYENVPEETRAPGCHIITGPIHVEGAEPGDTLECRVLHMAPRLNYGINFVGTWGLLNEEFGGKEHVFLYEADTHKGVARPVFQYEYDSPEKAIPGRFTTVDPSQRKPTMEGIAVPLRLHFGAAGVAPAESGKLSTIPPGSFGGNVDNREFIAGTSMFYPVHRPGALFSAGDTHFAEGDGEVNGTAIEAHVNATIQLILHKNKKLKNPVLETPKLWITHGFNEDLDLATREAVLEMIDLLEREWGISRVEAYSLCSVAGDLRITQVVDGVKGAHMAMPRNVKR